MCSSTIIRATDQSGLRNGDLKCLRVGTSAHFVPLIRSVMCDDRPAIEQHGELGGGGVVVISTLVTARRCPASLEFQLDPQDHEKVKWPPLLTM